jgi:hypothetical protein
MSPAVLILERYIQKSQHPAALILEEFMFKMSKQAGLILEGIFKNHNIRPPLC